VHLPGRVLRVGETWADSATREVFGSPIAVSTRGRYVRDTVVNGRTLNVIEIEGTDQRTISVSRGDVISTIVTRMVRREVIHWDSQRHVAVHRDASATVGTGSPQSNSVVETVYRFIWNLLEER
jgi:hypothetical protein